MYSVPTGVNSIGQGAFFDCENLTGVYIPMSVTEIQMYAFSGCTELSDVYYGGTVSEWEGITVSLFNDSLTAANLHDNALPLGIASLRVNKTTVAVDDTVTWTVTASDGNGAKQYRFDIYRDGQLIGQGSYNSANTCTYAVADAGIFSVRVYVKDSIGLTVSRDGGSVTVTDPGAAPVATEITGVENSGDTVKAAVRCGEAGSAAIYAARYGSGGRFLGLEIWQLTAGYNEVTVPRGEAIMVRFFVLDENYAPLCAPAEVPIA